MKLEGRYKVTIKELKSQNRIHSTNLENKEYCDSAKKIKDNFKLNLKNGGVIFGVPIDEAYLPICYRKTYI